MPDQETYGRFTPAARNLIKKVTLSDEEHEDLNLIIATKTETITLDEAKAMLYVIGRGKQKKYIKIRYNQKGGQKSPFKTSFWHKKIPEKSHIKFLINKVDEKRRKNRVTI